VLTCPARSSEPLMSGLRKRAVARRIALSVVLTVASLATGCGYRWWEPQPPARSFQPEDLLVDAGNLPATWECSGPYLPAGDDLVTPESVTVQYRTPGGEVQVEATNDVFRYRSAGIAERVFDNTYLAKVRYLQPVPQWTHEARGADQQHFGCYEWNEPIGLVCQWGGRYEEYIVLFRTRIVEDEMPLEDVWDVVQGLDARISAYLD
jgi:hypothetical protein